MANSPNVIFRLQAEQRDRLQALARQRNITTTALILDALQRAGYLAGSSEEESAA